MKLVKPYNSDRPQKLKVFLEEINRENSFFFFSESADTFIYSQRLCKHKAYHILLILKSIWSVHKQYVLHRVLFNHGIVYCTADNNDAA